MKKENHMDQSFEENVKTFIGLNDNIKKLEAKTKDLKAAKAKLESQILERFSETGISSVKMNGITVFLHRQLWAGVDRGEDESSKDAMKRAVAALKAAGYDDLVNEQFSSQSVSAIIREMDQNEEELPKEFEGAIKVAEKFSARVRHS